MKLYGIMNRIGVIDLSKSRIVYQFLSDKMVKEYIGGYGIGAHFLFHHQKKGIDPMGPESYIGFTTGPLTGTYAVSGSRFTVVGKSPKTGGWGDSNCGGSFGPAMKMAGFDHLFINGIAADPVIIVLQEGRAQIEPGGDLWGLCCAETEKRLINKFGKKSSVVCIGPAGERKSLLACVINDGGRAAGRSGLGALMGVKRIKAIVALMTSKVPVSDEEGLKVLRKEVISFYKKDNPGYDLFNKYGTSGVTANTVLKGDGPVKNWRGTARDFPTVSKISDDSLFAIKEKSYGCWKCPVACGGLVRLKEGKYKGLEGYKPEYETLNAFGSMCLNDDLSSIVKANNLCNDFGMDTISIGTTVAFAMELFERGILTEKDLGGLRMKWKDSEALVAFTEKLAMGNNPVAELFGNGMNSAALKIGNEAEKYAMQVGGEELPMHDPRCNPGLGASYIIDATPGRHTQWSSWMVEDGFVPDGLNLPPINDRYNYGGKGETHRIMSNYGHCLNMAGVCWFAASLGPAYHLPKALTLVTGNRFDMDDLMEIGDRAAALRISFNIREGVSNKDFSLPDRVLGAPPLSNGPNMGVTVDNVKEINDYLVAMKWDTKTYQPSKATLKRLGLDFVLKDLHG